ncbi:MAG TPA: nuclear transport factor 2 family protein [Acidimicrobiales bacterium]
MSDHSTATTAATAEAAATYFDAWRARDFDRLRTVLADEVTFAGPLGTAAGPEECLAGLRGLSEIVTDIEVLRRFADGPDALTWFELRTTVTPTPVPVANWSRVEDGRVIRIRATFDPRPLLTPAD